MIPDTDPNSIVYLNGEYQRLADAKISVLDRGFIFGDGIYDVVPVYAGKPFRMAAHLARLQRNLKILRLETGFTTADWEALVTDMIKRSGLSNCVVYIQVSRGVAKRDHAFPLGVKPTIFCMVNPFTRPTAQQRDQGLSAVSATDIRWQRCDIKSTSLLANILARQQAVDSGVDEVIQFRDGLLTEGSACNIWMVKDGELLAPPLDEHILEGIRYRLLEELAVQQDIPFVARPIAQHEVDTADELMLTSATKEVLPIVIYNGQPVGGTGRPGPIYRRLQAAYDKLVEL